VSHPAAILRHCSIAPVDSLIALQGRAGYRWQYRKPVAIRDVPFVQDVLPCPHLTEAVLRLAEEGSSS
jgi:hypothetical protein